MGGSGRRRHAPSTAASRPSKKFQACCSPSESGRSAVAIEPKHTKRKPRREREGLRKDAARFLTDSGCIGHITGSQPRTWCNRAGFPTWLFRVGVFVLPARQSGFVLEYRLQVFIVEVVAYQGKALPRFLSTDILEPAEETIEIVPDALTGTCSNMGIKCLSPGYS